MSFILLNCFLLVDSCMPRYGALLGQRERCGAGWGRMWWFGGGSEPLPAGPGASADCAEKELCWVAGADGAGTAPRRPLRGAAMSGDGTILCTMRRRRWRLRAVAAAAAAAKAAAADVAVGRSHVAAADSAAMAARRPLRGAAMGGDLMRAGGGDGRIGEAEGAAEQRRRAAWRGAGRLVLMQTSGREGVVCSAIRGAYLSCLNQPSR